MSVKFCLRQESRRNGHQSIDDDNDGLLCQFSILFLCLLSQYSVTPFERETECVRINMMHVCVREREGGSRVLGIEVIDVTIQLSSLCVNSLIIRSLLWG